MCSSTHYVFLVLACCRLCVVGFQSPFLIRAMSLCSFKLKRLSGKSGAMVIVASGKSMGFKEVVVFLRFFNSLGPKTMVFLKFLYVNV